MKTCCAMCGRSMIDESEGPRARPEGGWGVNPIACSVTLDKCKDGSYTLAVTASAGTGRDDASAIFDAECAKLGLSDSYVRDHRWPWSGRCYRIPVPAARIEEPAR